MLKQVKRLHRMMFLVVCALLVVGCNSGSTKVAPKVLRSVSVSPSSAALFNGPAGSSCSAGSQQLAATGKYSDGTTADVTSQATWASSDSTVATVSNSGLASAAGGKAGTATITAMVSGVAGTTSVSASTLSQPAMTPIKPTMAATAGTTQQFTLTGTLTNASGSTTTQDLTTSAAWSVSNGTTSGSANANGVASVGISTGIVSPVAAGNTQVTAAVCGVTAQTNVYVVSSGAVALSLTPASTISVGSTQTLTASEIYVDGTTNPIEADVIWSSSSPNVEVIPYGTHNASVIVVALNTPASAAAAAAAMKTGGSGVVGHASSANSVTVTPTVTLASGANVSGSVTFSVQPALARFVFSSGYFANAVSSYALGSGILTPIGKTFLGNASYIGAGQLLVHPSGKFLYVVDQYYGGVSPISVDAVTGGLASINSLQEIPINFNNVLRGAIDPTGQFLYIVSDMSAQILGFSISQSTGALTPISGITGSVNAPVDIKIDPAGPTVFVLNAGGNTLSSFTIGAGGSLAPTKYAPFVLAGTPSLAAIDPTGAFLYVTENSGTVEVVSAANLSRVGASPYSITGFSAISNALVDPSGGYLYLVDSPVFGAGNAPQGHVLVMGLSSGAITSATPSGSYSTGVGPMGMAMDPGGTQLVVENGGSNTLNVFSVSNGVLTPSSTVEGNGDAADVAIYTAPATATVSSIELFATNGVSGKLAAFNVGAGGVLVPDSKSPTTTDISNANALVAASATGIIVTSQGACPASPPPYACSGSQIGAYQFNPSGTTGTVTPMAGFPYNSFSDVSVAADISGTIFYGNGPGVVESYVLNPTTNLLSTPPVSFISNIEAGIMPSQLITDPQSSLMFFLFPAFVPNYPNSGAGIGCLYNPSGSGVLSFCSADYLMLANSHFTSASVSADGLSIVALDSAAKTLNGFVVSPLGLWFGSQLQPEGAPLTLTGSPSSVVFDPRGRYVLINDAAAGTVSAYSFNSAGTPTPFTATGTPITLPSGKGAPATPVFDATGAYLFVPLFGNPSATPAVPGSIAVYAVTVTGQTPAFTAVAGSPFAAGDTTTGLGTSAVAVINGVH